MLKRTRLLAITLLFGLVALHGCNKPSRPGEIFFNGQMYQYAEVMRGGDVQNYFYTPNGEGLNAGAKEFVQLVMFDHEIPTENRRQSIPGLANHYGLKAGTADASAYSGTIAKGPNLHIVSFGREIMVDDRLQFAIYVKMVPASEAAATLTRIRDEIELSLRLLPDKL